MWMGIALGDESAVTKAVQYSALESSSKRGHNKYRRHADGSTQSMKKGNLVDAKNHPSKYDVEP
jgi:hypothetical protein